MVKDILADFAAKGALNAVSIIKSYEAKTAVFFFIVTL